MASIEKVTSVKKQITNKDTGKKTTVKAHGFIPSAGRVSQLGILGLE